MTNFFDGLYYSKTIAEFEAIAKEVEMRDRLKQFGIKGCEIILVHGSPRSARTAIIKNLASMFEFEFTSLVQGFSFNGVGDSKYLFHVEGSNPGQLETAIACFKEILFKNKSLLVFEISSKDFYEAKESFLPMIDYAVDVPPINKIKKESAAKFVSTRLTQKGFYCDEETVNNGLLSSSVVYWDVNDLIWISDLVVKSILIYGSVDDQSITSKVVEAIVKEAEFKGVLTKIQECFKE